jgi:predicted Fe-S protein YdhL (DUF1289 family)
MSVRAVFASCLFVALLSTSIAPAGENPGNSPPASTERSHRGHKMAGLPRELRIMWRREEHVRIKSMPKEQRRGWMKREWASMSEGERHAKLAELQAKWNALPPNVRQAVLEKKREKHEARRMRKAGESTGETGASPAHQH